MRRTWSRSSAALSIVVLAAVVQAGCAVGPTYHPPNVSVPDRWSVASPPPAGTGSEQSGAAALAAWWTVFQDPTLDQLIGRAVQSNLTLQQARARIVQARAARTSAAAGLWPSVAGTASNGTSSGPSGGGASVSPPRRNLFQAGFDASWELDLFGGVRRSVEAATASLQAAVEDSRDVMVTLTAEVALDYVTLRGLQQQIAIAEQNLAAQRETADITRKRLSVGFVSGLDVANAEAQVATTQSAIPLLESARQQEIYALSVLLGREPLALVAELSPVQVARPAPAGTEAGLPGGLIPRASPAVPLGLPSELLQRRPDIRRAEAQLHGATAQVGVATANLFPKISLTGSAGWQKLTQGALLGAAGAFWSLVPSVTQSIFDAGRNRANVRVQEAVRDETLLAYRQTVLTALQDVESALIAYAKDQEHRGALADAVASNRTAVDLSTRLYTAGELDFLNLLTAQRNLYTSEDSLAQADRSIALDLIALYKALGGGWQAQAGPAVPPAGR